MTSYPPIGLRALFRASHSSLWELAEGAGILDDLNIRFVSFDPCASSAVAESALAEGTVDLVVGNHVTLYGKVARGEPIVCLASPKNVVGASIVTREPIDDLSALRDKRIIDETPKDPRAGFAHGALNRMLYLRRAGIPFDHVDRVERKPGVGLQQLKIDAMTSGRADAAFATGSAKAYEEAGLHILELPELPMINGPTITTSYLALHAHDQLGERLVMAQLRAIALVHTDPASAHESLKKGSRGFVPVTDQTVARLGRLQPKPYPAPQAVINAHEICCIQHPEAEEMNPLAVWDLHYLRELDQSGFIDGLYE